VSYKHVPPYKQEELDEAYAVLRGSGLILIKLDIGYGLIGQSEESIRRMYELKGRSENNPCVVPGNLTVLRSLCPGVHPAVLDWIGEQAKWTPLSVIDNLYSQSPLWLSLPALVRHYSSRNGSVAVFFNAGEFMDALVVRALRDQKLLAGSSGNLSGKGNSFRPEELAPSLIEGVDLFIDHGVARYENPQRLATTMIDLRTLQVTRRGINHSQLEARLVGLRAQMSLRSGGDAHYTFLHTNSVDDSV
jgi:tRNA A37 threonylcarbamoyladenosine synthetase subunit TsaC/SUA5/YrdC